MDQKGMKSPKMSSTMIQMLHRIPFRGHLLLGFIVRIATIMYGEFQDRYAEVPFTDVDYRVVTDGARHILNNESPYNRATYRYTPILAILLTTNIFIHPAFGKIIFSLFDILITVLTRQIILDEHLHTFEANAASVLAKSKRKLTKDPRSVRFVLSEKHIQQATFYSFFWLYNPFAIVIATRGNGDSITGLLILLTIFALQRCFRQQQQQQGDGLKYVVLAGISHSLAIHFRLYPLAFSLAYYANLANATGGPPNLLRAIFQFNRKQLTLAFTTIASLAMLTGVFYYLYGYQFVYESYLYHLMRKDTRHNFSLYFYMNYLNSQPNLMEKVLTFLPQFVLLIMFNVAFGTHRKMLGFCIFLQSFLIVTFNPVVTSQYFIWYLVILPICLKNLKSLKLSRALSYCGLWASVQAIWLYSAYLLEFKGWNTFGFIWMQGCIFFAVNCFIMKVLIVNFDIIADF